MATITQIPEILHIIAHHLLFSPSSSSSATTLHACTKVCLQWRDIFTPYLWHTVDPSLPPFSRIFNRPGKRLHERRRRLEKAVGLLRQFGGYVRELVVTDSTVLLAAVEVGVVRELEGLVFRAARSVDSTVEEEFSWERKCLQQDEELRPLLTVLDRCPWEGVIPRKVFEDERYKGPAARTRASWFLVRRNPRLKRLEFHKSWSGLWFRMGHIPVPPSQGLYILQRSHWVLPEAVAFLQEMFLERLLALRLLELGHGVEEAMLNVLNKYLPRLESFVYSEKRYFEPLAIEMSQRRQQEEEWAPQGVLKRLVVKDVVSGDQVREWVKAFPGVREFVVGGVPTDEHIRGLEEEESDLDEGVPGYDYGFPHQSDGDDDDEEDSDMNTTAFIPPSKKVLEWTSVESIAVVEHDPDSYDFAKTEGRRDWSSPTISPFVDTVGGLLEARIRFPNVTRIDGVITLPSADMSQRLLWALPAVLRVECSSLVCGGGGGSFADTNADLAVYDGDDDGFRDHPIQELVFRNSTGSTSSAPGNLEQMFFRMSCLVDVNIQGYGLDGAMVLKLIRTCRSLRHVWFDLKKPDTDDYEEREEGCSVSSRAMVDILAEFPETLKSCRGRGHVVLATDLVGSQEWGCEGSLEELDIEVLGVPRLTRKQEEKLDDLWRKLDPSFSGVTTDAVVISVQQQLRRDLTSDESEALTLLQQSHTLQRQVYHRIGKLTSLQRLTFGRPTEYLSRTPPSRLDTLDFSLASGLAELGGWRSLQKVEFFGIDLRIGAKEMEWVREHWGLMAEVDDGVVRSRFKGKSWYLCLKAGVGSRE